MDHKISAPPKQGQEPQPCSVCLSGWPNALRVVCSPAHSHTSKRKKCTWWFFRLLVWVNLEIVGFLEWTGMHVDTLELKVQMFKLSFALEGHCLLKHIYIIK